MKPLEFETYLPGFHVPHSVLTLSAVGSSVALVVITKITGKTHDMNGLISRISVKA